MKNTVCFIIMFFCVYQSLAQTKADTTKESEDFRYVTLIIPEDENFVEYREYFYSNTKEIELNMTELAGKFIPFNFGFFDNELVGIKFKKYYRTTAFRMSFGADTNFGFSNNDDNFFFLSIGYERRNQIIKKWTYTKGWELFVFSDLNDQGGIGVSRFYGLEYNINQNVAIGTEGSLRVGNIDGNLDISFAVPRSVFVKLGFSKN